MASSQDIKRRIKSVRSTSQITKAMQLVAASKLRRAQEAALGPKEYTRAAKEVLANLSGAMGGVTHPLYAKRPVKNVLTILIAGDRGMAGAYNANIFKALLWHTKNVEARHKIICIGRHAALQVARLPEVEEVAAYDIDVADADVALAQPALEEAIEAFSSGEADEVYVIYTKFHSTVKQEAFRGQLLPAHADSPNNQERTLEPNPEELIEFATRRLLEAQMLQAIYEARASEQASRMLAMMNATDNAKELISDLTLAFNNARQAAITQELAEISAGAEAIV